ncbi:MAG: L,D-transpeptidase family protein [Burkholderiales bacterium]|nr:L,D-transpeptidase family protein [Burkholderiales bacterium]MBH2017288.1 L,D-transpeptidase family protein [Burkholderiales bacterium]
MSFVFREPAPRGAGNVLRVVAMGLATGLLAGMLALSSAAPCHAQSEGTRASSARKKPPESGDRRARATEARHTDGKKAARASRKKDDTKATARRASDRVTARQAGRATTQAGVAGLVTAGAIATANGAPAPGMMRASATLARQAPPAEARLLEVYRHIGRGEGREALDKAQSLVQDVPHFQLAQLVYGDLLLAQTRKLPAMGQAPADLAARAPARLDQLKQEAERRLAALRERPPVGTIPAQFIELPSTTRHAIAVDASRSRLYLFENGPRGLQLVADHYASIGKLGSDKSVEGDQRTPLGVYFITSRLEARQLTDFYGVGALTLNYPNEYDRRLGRTGSGIWLHGVPAESYARSPQSTDGCVVLANPELQSIIERVQPRNTPVVIARNLQWVPPAVKEPERRSLNNLLEGWRTARASGDVNRLMSFYSSQFSTGSKDIGQWRQAIERDIGQARGRELQLKDVSILGWKDKSDVLVVTFGEVAEGQRTGAVKRQYWGKEGGLWKIFYEGVIG